MLNAVESFSDSLGVPVIIGEFGVENQNNDADRASYAGYYVQQAASPGSDVSGGITESLITAVTEFLTVTHLHGMKASLRL